MKNLNLLLFALCIGTLSIATRDVLVATEDVTEEILVVENPIVDESCASFDVLVYDATSGGIIAAVAAARSGIAKALREPRHHCLDDPRGARRGGVVVQIDHRTPD